MNILADQTQAATHIDQADDNRISRLPLEDQAGGILFIHADAKGVCFNTGLAGGNARTDFEHVGAKTVFLPLDQMVGVVLHKC